MSLARAFASPGFPLNGSAYGRRVIDMAGTCADMGMWVCDLSTETLDWTSGAYDLFGLPRGRPLRRQQAVELYDPQSLATLNRVRADAIRNQSGFVLDAQIITPAGKRRWIRIHAQVQSERNKPVRLLGMKQDVTELKQALEELRRRADFDALTGLASRSQFEARLEEVCASGEPAALLLVDVDGFKTVNDTVGHAGGDDCIRKLANRLAGVCHGADLVARLGGDEFGVIVAARRPHPTSLARDIVLAFSRPLHCAGAKFQLGASVGMAQIGGERRASIVFEVADQLLYEAKFAGGANYRLAM
jgi:diguanylate cyclase (GGDEF)-like protein